VCSGINVSIFVSFSVTRLGESSNLGSFLLNQFSPKQAVSNHGLFEGLKSSLMSWAFKLRVDIYILMFLTTLYKHGRNFNNFLVTLVSL